LGSASTPQTPTNSASRSSNLAPISKTSSPSHIAISRSSSPRLGGGTWICSICSFANPFPSNFEIATANIYTPLPPCLACGIKPSLAHVLKAAISTSSGRQSFKVSNPAALPPPDSHEHSSADAVNVLSNFPQGPTSLEPAEARFQCPRCTFRNHPQLLSCELCGAPLLSDEAPIAAGFTSNTNRPESPGLNMDSSSTLGNGSHCVKLSFRASGDKIFYERLKGAMVQRKWLLKNAPPVPKPSQVWRGMSGLESATSNHRDQTPRDQSKVVGIAGLERRGQEQRKNNEVAIGTAFEDLEALMASAKEIVALAESFGKTSSHGSSEANALLMESAAALGMVTTKEMLGSSAGSESLYLSELSRNVAEYLTDDARGILKKEGGIMSLVDLWAVFNRARGGADLISPMEFEKATRLWEKLNLPVRLRRFKNGLLVVQRYDWTDDKTIAQLLVWFQEMHVTPPMGETNWDWTTFGRGVTAQETAQRFGWSVGVASEELEMAEEKGVLCRDEGVEGLRFWENFIVDEDTPSSKPEGARTKVLAANGR
jgi:ESCRT-II complex subunit VPS36